MVFHLVVESAGEPGNDTVTGREVGRGAQLVRSPVGVQVMLISRRDDEVDFFHRMSQLKNDTDDQAGGEGVDPESDEESGDTVELQRQHDIEQYIQDLGQPESDVHTQRQLDVVALADLA